MTSVFEGMIDHIHKTMDKTDKGAAEIKQKRPLKMPKNYDFSVRNVDWRQYKDDYMLRTDAVWEKTKLLDMFYMQYKSKFIYDSFNNKYMIANIR